MYNLIFFLILLFILTIKLAKKICYKKKKSKSEKLKKSYLNI